MCFMQIAYSIYVAASVGSILTALLAKPFQFGNFAALAS
jgi:hypothetical protein